MITGIYKIENQINGKVYIGQSVNITKRWQEHRSRAFNSSDRCYNLYLYKAIRKYGLNNFSFEILEECPESELNSREIFYISLFNSSNKDNGYNLTKGGASILKYNYEEIYQSWNKGLTCKELQEKFQCSSGVISNALRSHNVSIFEVKSRSNYNQKKPIVALSVNNLPLKIFDSKKDAIIFFTKDASCSDNLAEAIKKHYRAFGYYWEYLNGNNIPDKELTDEEFLSYQQISAYFHATTQDTKEKLSFQQRTVERPSREELKNLIRTKPFTQIGQMYGVSDNAIRKWCDAEKLPRKKTEINNYTDEEWANI